MKNLLTKKWSVIVIAIFCACLWGSAFPVLKLSYEEMQIDTTQTFTILSLAGVRFFLAGLFLLFIMLWVNRRAMRLTRRNVYVLIVFGIIQTALQYVFFYIGLANTTGMKGAILDASGTFFAVILAHYFYVNDKMNWQKLVGIVTGFIGIIMTNWGQGFQLVFTITGEGFMILAALTGAVGTIMAKEIAIGIHPFVLTGWQLAIGGFLLLVIGVPQMEPNSYVITPLAIWLLVYSIFLSAIAFALWYSLLKYNKAGEISLYKFFIPVSGAILSGIMLKDERLSMSVIVALAFVAIGFIAINYEKKTIK